MVCFQLVQMRIDDGLEFFLDGVVVVIKVDTATRQNPRGIVQLVDPTRSHARHGAHIGPAGLAID
ncbi:MAG: hypothetical protein NVSMB6_03970 [Burkholderiaceae bacterium]